MRKGRAYFANSSSTKGVNSIPLCWRIQKGGCGERGLVYIVVIKSVYAFTFIHEVREEEKSAK